MKKYLALLAIAAVFGACQNEKADPDVVSTGEEVTEFGASIPEVDSKTYLSAKDGSVWHTLWGNGDAININGVASNALSTGDGYVGTGYARFTMKSGVSPTFYYAYPAGKVSSYNASSHTATVTIPTEQTWVSGQYDPNAYVMVGSGSSTQLSFHPLMGLLKISPTAPAEGTLYVEKVRVEAIGGEKLSGAFTTNYSALSGGTESYVDVIPASRQAFGTPFTAVIPAQTYDEGLRVSIYANTAASGDGTQKIMVFSKQSSITVDPSTQIPLTAPEFKESEITLSCPFKTSSSAGFEWSGANPSDNKNFRKDWRLAIYSDSGCNTLVVQHDIPKMSTVAISDGVVSTEGVWKGMQVNGKACFIVGGLNAGTTYYCKLTDILNGISKVISFTTDPFTRVSASSPSGSILVAEDFSEFGWGPAFCGNASTSHRYAGWSPVSGASSNVSFAAPSGVVTTGYYKKYEYASNEISSNFDYSTAPRFSLNSSSTDGWGWYSEGGFNGYIQAGHIRMGGWNTNRTFVVLPTLRITSGKYATVDVTVKVGRYNSSEVSGNPYFAVFFESGLTLGSYRKYGGDLVNRRYFASLTKYGHESQELTYRINGLTSSDHLMVGCYDRISTYNRFILYSVKVEKVSESSTETFDITDPETLELFRSRVAGGATSLNGNVINDIDASSIASSWTPIAGYTGTLTGNDKTISNLTKPFFDDLQGTVQHLTLNSTLNITSDQQYIGMFANTMTAGASLSNCTARGSVTFGAGTQGGDEHAMGGLVGHADGGSMSYCYNYAGVTNSTIISNLEFSIGGIIGHVWPASDGSFSISNCTNYGDVENTGNNTNSNICIGGVMGQIGSADSTPHATLTITSCRNEGEVNNSGNVTASGKSIYIGGISGFARWLSVSGCANITKGSGTESVINSGTATNVIFIGGLLGESRKSTYSTVCYNTGAVKNTGAASGEVRLGGLIGSAGDENTLNGTSSSVCNYNNGPVTENSTSSLIKVGGVCGWVDDSSTNLNYSQNKSDGDITIVDGTRQYTYVGGVLGCSNTTPSFSYTQNAGTIEFSNLTVSKAVYAGGINGGFTANGTQTITRCENTGDIYCPNSGGNGGNMKASSKDDINGTMTYIGGISGNAGNGGARTGRTFTYCINRGDITVHGQVPTRLGGCLGYANKNPSYCENHGEILTYRYNTVTGSSWNGATGGVVGYMNIATASNLTNTARIQTTGSSPNTYTGGIVGMDCDSGTGNMTAMVNCNVGKSGINIVGAGSGSFGSTGAGLFVAAYAEKAWTFTNCKVITGTKCQGVIVTADNMAEAVVGRKHTSSTSSLPTLVSSF